MLLRIDDFIVTLLSMLYSKNLFIFRTLHYCLLVGVSLVCFSFIGETHFNSIPFTFSLTEFWNPKTLGVVVFIYAFLSYGLYADSAAIHTYKNSEGWKFNRLFKLLKKH